MNTKGVNFQPSKRGQFSAAVDNSAVHVRSACVCPIAENAVPSARGHDATDLMWAVQCAYERRRLSISAFSACHGVLDSDLLEPSAFRNALAIDGLATAAPTRGANPQPSGCPRRPASTTSCCATTPGRSCSPARTSQSRSCRPPPRPELPPPATTAWPVGG
jgi:hypothetical protein